MTVSSALSFPVFSLPRDPLTPLDPDERPNPLSIRKLQLELFDNARAITSTLGGGALGHLGMHVNDYIELDGAAEYIFPDRPALPNYAGMNDNERADAQDEYKNDLQQFMEAQGFHTQIKRLILKAVPPIYIATLADDIHGFAAVLARTILQHLITTYGTIRPEDLDANLRCLEQPWDPATPIETVFVNGRTCRNFARAGNDPITDATYIRHLIKTFTNAGVFTQAIHEWNLKGNLIKTVPNLTAHFTHADVERRLMDPTTKATLAANAAQKAAPASDSPTGLGWCWSHGLGNNPAHTSMTCNKPAPGHNKHATLYNMMGGNNTIRRQPGEKPVYVPPKRATAKTAPTTVKDE